MNKRRWAYLIPMLLVVVLAMPVFADTPYESLRRSAMPNGDQLIEASDWSTTRSTLILVKASMKSNSDVNVDSQVFQLLQEFNAQGVEDHTLNGIWGRNTPQGRVKGKVEGGQSYKAAKVDVLVEDGLSGDMAEAYVDVEELYDLKKITWSDSRTLRNKAASHPARVKRMAVKIKGGKTIVEAEAEAIEEDRAAAFYVSRLTISPRSIIQGNHTTIAVDIHNTGQEAWIFDVVLEVDGVPTLYKSLRLTEGKTRKVVFKLRGIIVGDHTVAVGALTDTFSVVSSN